MNKKGFTLIELLAVIVLIGIIGIITVPNLLDVYTSSKNESYNLLVKNIVTASQNYYEECEYGDLSNRDKYGSYACSINNNQININLGTLANTGFLSVTDTDKTDKSKKVVLDPRNKENDISACQITITKETQNSKDENGITNIKVTYKVIADESANCPKTSEYQGEQK